MMILSLAWPERKRRRRKIRFLSGLASALVGIACTVSSAGAEDECFPNLIKFDVCAAVRRMQSEAADALPMKLSNEMTIASAAAFGPLFSMTIVWNFTNSEIDALLNQGGMSRDDLFTKMDEQTRSMVCGQEPTAAGIGLGARIQYVYRTLDGVPVHTSLVTACP